MIGSAVISGSMPITAAMAQEMAPESRSLASSVVMGLSWGLGGFVMLPLGMIADRMGLVVTMGCIALLPLAALPFLVLKVKKDD
jgi:FSR family fosmidomycin resistance protein-like MFS transporter